MSTIILNPFEIFDEAPIMSFQTDKNGTFDPSFTLAAGTLKWIIDGEEQITNSPSKVLTGSTVDVEVFANDVPAGTESSVTLFNIKNIIGTLNFSHFTLTGTFSLSTNANLTNVIFSEFVNSMNIALLNSCNLGNLDLSNTQIAGQLNTAVNSGLSSIISPTVYSPGLDAYNVRDCALGQTSVDEILTTLDAYMGTNTPTDNLTVNTSGGTNASPSATGDAAIVSLTSIYSGAGFTFTAIIN